jgi:oleandomycin transport system ATP-binding protein
MSQAIQTENLRKSFGRTPALAGIDLAVPAGAVYGLLGPNGAGKTTAVRILATLVRPDAGRAWVAGLDVVAQAGEVRRQVGLTGQFTALDEALTGRDNLVLIGRLHRMRAAAARLRAAELLELVGLTEAAHRPVRTYSGGMRRRIDLAASLVGRPRVLFLDEPTTGLDPASRAELWVLIREMVRDGTTVLLTSQYLEEVDRLASRIAVLDHGRVIAEGTPSELKARTGGQVVAVRVAPEQEAQALAVLALVGIDSPRREAEEMVVPVRGVSDLVEVGRRLGAAGLAVEELALRRPTLDEVFLSLTGRSVEAEEVA